MSKRAAEWESALLRGDMVDCCTLLQEGMSATDLTQYGSLPLARAARHGHLELCKLFLESGAVPNATDWLGHTPLHAAQTYSKDAMVGWLLAAGADPGFVPQDAKAHYRTPFQCAVGSGLSDLVHRYLLEFGQDPRQCTLKGESMLQLAEGHAETTAMLHAVITELAVKGVMADDDKVDVPAPRARGMSPL